MKRNITALKPQDIVVLLRLLLWKKERPWTFAQLAEDLGMSQSEVHQSIRRAQLSGLYDALTKRPKRPALVEFLIHGLKYAFPPLLGDMVKGVPTAHAAPPLSDQISSSPDTNYVWPMKGGKVLGKEINPLHKNVPVLIKKIPEIYPLLTLIDGLRVGRVREKEIAEKELYERVMSA
jgi:hypothetical protein